MVKRHGHDGKIDTPLKKRKISEDGKSASDTETSTGGSSEGSDVLVATTTNQDLVVCVREAITTSSSIKVALLSILNSRVDTNLGKTQGDHVTAYRSFLEMLVAATEGNSLKKTANVITEIAKSLMPDKIAKFDKVLKNLQDEIEKTATIELRHRVLKDLRALKGFKGTKRYTDEEIEILREDLKSRRRAVYMRAVEQIGQEFIKQINLDEETAFKKEGPSDTGEGARVKKAIHALKAINYLKSIYEEKDSEARETRMDRFYSKYIEIGAPYKDEANAIFGENKVKDLNKKWTSILDKKAFLNKLYTDTNKEIIGDFFGDLFDFKYSVHASKPRPDTLLYKVVAKHIVIMFHAFDEFQLFDNDTKKEIIDQFLQQKILEKEGWSNFKIFQKGKKVTMNLEFLKEGINKYLNFAEYRMLSDSEIDANQKASDASKIQGKGMSK